MGTVGMGHIFCTAERYLKFGSRTTYAYAVNRIESTAEKNSVTSADVTNSYHHAGNHTETRTDIQTRRQRTKMFSFWKTVTEQHNNEKQTLSETNNPQNPTTKQNNNKKTNRNKYWKTVKQAERKKKRETLRKTKPKTTWLKKQQPKNKLTKTRHN